MPNKRFGALSSSANPQELSLTVVSMVRLIVAVLIGAGVLTVTGGDALLEQAPIIVSAGLATWEASNVLWGAFRKVINAVYPT